MRRPHNVFWDVTTFESFMYYGRKHGWQSITCDLKNACSSHCRCYTSSRALKCAAQLKAKCVKEVILLKWSYRNGIRVGLDYSYID